MIDLHHSDYGNASVGQSRAFAILVQRCEVVTNLMKSMCCNLQVGIDSGKRKNKKAQKEKEKEAKKKTENAKRPISEKKGRKVNELNAQKRNLMCTQGVKMPRAQGKKRPDRPTKNSEAGVAWRE